MKKGAERSELHGEVKPRTSAYSHQGKFAKSKKVTTHHMPHADLHMKHKGREGSDNSTAGNRA